MANQIYLYAGFHKDGEKIVTEFPDFSRMQLELAKDRLLITMFIPASIEESDMVAEYTFGMRLSDDRPMGMANAAIVLLRSAGFDFSRFLPCNAPHYDEIKTTHVPYEVALWAYESQGMLEHVSERIGTHSSFDATKARRLLKPLGGLATTLATLGRIPASSEERLEGAVLKSNLSQELKDFLLEYLKGGLDPAPSTGELTAHWNKGG